MTNENAMYRAIILGETANARTLITKDPEVLKLFVINKSWLHWAAQEGNIELMELFVKAGIPIDLLTSDGADTPLETAAGFGHYEACKWLIDHGADVNHGLGKSSTPVIDAIYSKSLELVELFVQRGADLSVKFGPPPQIDVISFAKTNGTPEIVSFLKKRMNRIES
jgi:ankyrin repeat protein